MCADVLVGFQDGSASVAEDGGSIIVGVFLSGEADAAISVQYSTVDGSAVGMLSEFLITPHWNVL